MVVCTVVLLATDSSARKLRELIPGLYGGNGITLAPASGHAPHFTIDAAASINRLNEQIANEIGVFPFTSAVGGFTFEFDESRGAFVRSTSSLGPLFAERAPTLGRGKFNLSAAFTFFQFDTFEGEDLSNLRVPTRHQTDSIGNPNIREDFELDTILITVDMDTRVRLFSLAATYGVTDRLDVGILLPLVQVDMKLKSNARILTSPENSLPGVHTFVGAEDNTVDQSSGDAFGIGDIVLRAKYHLVKDSILDLAGALLVKLETGDEDNFLGSGATTIRPFLILSKTFFNAFTPHLNIGYEFNLARSKQSALEYAIGFEVGSEQFTVVGEFLGSHELKGDGIGDDILTGSLGAKWNPFKQFVMFLNFQIPLNDSGLRSNLITTFGAEYSF